MKLPEPSYAVGSGDLPAYSKAQLIQALKDWSEGLAVICDDYHLVPGKYPVDCAVAIREKSKELK